MAQRQASKRKTLREIETEGPKRKAGRDDQRLRLVLESTDDIVAMLDKEGRCLYYHGPGEYGLKDQDLRGKTPADLLDLTTSVSITVRIRHVAATGKPLVFEQRVEWKGKVFWFLARISPVLDEVGSVTATVLVARNITVRKQAEESLRTANMMLERTFAGLNEAVFVIHPTLGTVTTCNAAVTRIFGYRTEEVVGQTVALIFPGGMDYSAYMTAAADTLGKGGIFSGEFQNRTKDGALLSTEHTVTAIRDDGGKPSNLLTVVRDITERKRVEEVLLRARNLESIGYLAGGIAHDFNNLLTAIIGNLSLVRMKIDPEEKVMKRLEDAEKACIRASALTKKLITFSRGGTPIRQPMSLGNLIREEAGYSLNNTETTFAFEDPGDLWPVSGDEGQIGQAIDAIVRNASEAMNGEGHLTITAENLEAESVKGLPLKGGDYIRVSFADSGPGIPEENLPKIFDPYFTTKEMGSQKGMGLGLALAHSIVTNHEGTITVESRPEWGTIFHLFLPAREKP